jgi:hypothetical protein
MSGNISEDVVRVHLENPQDINVQRTEEREPEHFVFSTVVIAFGVPGLNPYEQVLAEDPLRKDWSILAIDAPIVICNKSQISDKANQVAGVPFPQGAYVPQGGAVTGTGTAQIFAVATSATPCRVSVYVNRRSV